MSNLCLLSNFVRQNPTRPSLLKRNNRYPILLFVVFFFFLAWLMSFTTWFWNVSAKVINNIFTLNYNACIFMFMFWTNWMQILYHLANFNGIPINEIVTCVVNEWAWLVSCCYKCYVTGNRSVVHDLSYNNRLSPVWNVWNNIKY